MSFAYFYSQHADHLYNRCCHQHKCHCGDCSRNYCTCWISAGSTTAYVSRIGLWVLSHIHPPINSRRSHPMHCSKLVQSMRKWFNWDKIGPMNSQTYSVFKWKHMKFACLYSPQQTVPWMNFRRQDPLQLTTTLLWYSITMQGGLDLPLPVVSIQSHSRPQTTLLYKVLNTFARKSRAKWSFKLTDQISYQ